jgi:hypothetical protein
VFKTKKNKLQLAAEINLNVVDITTTPADKMADFFLCQYQDRQCYLSTISSSGFV